MARFAVLLAAALFAARARADDDDFPAREKTTVRVGYFEDSIPLMGGIGAGLFDDDDYEFVWYPQASGASAAAKLDRGDLDAAVLGSHPAATFYARGVDFTTFYVQYEITAEEALAVRDVYESPRDLEGLTLAAPFSSTAHTHLLFVRDEFALDFNVVDLAPGDAWRAAWDAGAIDGGYIWAATLEHMLENGGRKLVDSGQLAAWGNANHQVVAARGDFARRQPAAVDRLAGVMGRVAESFTREATRVAAGGLELGPVAGWDLWDPVKADGLAAAAAAAWGKDPAAPEDRRAVVDDFAKPRLVSPLDQLTCAYLSDACGGPGGLEVMYQKAAAVDVSEKLLATAEPEGLWYPRADRPPRVDAQYLERGLAATPPQERVTGYVPAAQPAPVACEAFNELSGSGVVELTGAYRPDQRCVWVVRADVARVTVSRIGLWAGDELSFYEGEPADGDVSTLRLLGKASGFEAAAAMDYAAAGALTVVFVADGFTDGAFAPRGPERLRDGFAFSYYPGGSCASGGRAENCRGTCDGGVCRCPPGLGGPTCAAPLARCQGTVVSSAAEGAFASGADALDEGAAYAQKSECVFAVAARPSCGVGKCWPTAFVRFEITFDLEATWDFLDVIEGAPGLTASPRLATVLSGRASDASFEASGPYAITVPATDGYASLRLRTDAAASRSGFRASYRALPAPCVADADCGSGVCQPGGECACPEGSFGRACGAGQCLRDGGNEDGGNGIVIRSNADALKYAALVTCVWTLGGTAPGARLIVWRADFEEGDALIVRDAADGALLARIEPRENATYDFLTSRIELDWETDRNNGGDSFRGVRAEFFPLLKCPDPSATCEQFFGGVCDDLRNCFINGSAYDCVGCLGGAPPGSYLVDAASNRYLPCPAGYEQPTAGNQNVGVEACTPCGPRRYSEQPGTARCSRCPDDSWIYPGTYDTSTSASDCVCEAGFYARHYPIQSCHQCPDDASCLGGLIQPYPQTHFWTPLLEDRGTERPEVTRCRYSFFCPGGDRKNTKWRAECLAPEAKPNNTARHEVLCRGPDEMIELVDPSLVDGRGWCREGRDPRSPRCEDEVEEARGISWFALSTLTVRCPKARPGRVTMVVLV